MAGAKFGDTNANCLTEPSGSSPAREDGKHALLRWAMTVISLGQTTDGSTGPEVGPTGPKRMSKMSARPVGSDIVNDDIVELRDGGERAL